MLPFKAETNEWEKLHISHIAALIKPRSRGPALDFVKVKALNP